MRLLTATNDVFSALENFLRQINGEKYRQQETSLSNSAIGQHTRHAIEFFQCLISQSATGIINYDKRSRNQLMEENPEVALEALEQIKMMIADNASDKPLLLETSFSERDDDEFLVPTSFHREWSNVLEHAIHHMAIIKIGLKMIAPEVSVPDNFGVAPSTVKHRNRQCAQ